MAEAALGGFLRFAAEKLEAASAGLQDEDAESDYRELVSFTLGFAQHLKSTVLAHHGSAELRHMLSERMESIWDLRTDKPGPNLSVDALRGVIQAMLSDFPPAADAAEHHPADDLPAGLAQMTLQDAVKYMWEVLDKGNRLEWGETGFILDLQQRGSFGRDKASAPLFYSMNKEHPFWHSPVTKAFIALLDNYERTTGVAEVVTSEEKREMSVFLDALLETKVMRFAFAYLRAKGVDSRCAKLQRISDFKNLLFDIWFAPYRRYRDNDSSGFEHVFVGEVSRGKVIGLHNWVQFYLEEQKGHVDYFDGKQDSDYCDDVNLVSVSFGWTEDNEDVSKPMSTILCGSTIEFEFAALTIAFLAGNQDGDNLLRLGSEDVSITCYPQNVKYGGPKVGTAYLSIP